MDINQLIKNSKDEQTRLQLVEALNPLIISSIRKYCPIKEEFEDLMQDGKMIVLECIETYQEEKGHFLNYVKNYLKYYYLDTLKYLVKYESKNTLFEMDEEIEDENNIEETIENKELGKELYSAIKELTERQRTILIMYYVENKTHAEIAEKLNIKIRTVINTKTRAIEIIRTKMKRRKNDNR